MRRVALISLLLASAGASAAAPVTWTHDGWYRLEIFPTLTIQGGPFVTQNVCGKTLPADEDDIVKCAHLAKAGDEVDVALTFFADAIKLNPRDAMSMNYRGILFARLEQYDRAVAEHTAAIKADPDDYWAFVFRGAVYEKMNRKADAANDYREALGRNPGEAPLVARLKAALTELSAAP